MVHPQLNLGDRLETRKVGQTRGGVLDGNGEEMVKLRSVVTIGIWPSKIIGSKDKLVADLASALKPVANLDNVADLTARVNNPANAEQFIEVITLRREVYDTDRGRSCRR